MLIIKEGNLFEHVKAPGVVAHGCNAKGKMQSGFAKEIRLRFPGNYVTYAEAHAQEGLRLNDVILHAEETPDGTIHIANLITQEDYGRDPGVVYIDYDAIEHTLRIVKDFATKSNLPIHFPFIGGGLGGGGHHRLLSIFNTVFDDYDATLWINEHIKGKLAESGITLSVESNHGK